MIHSEVLNEDGTLRSSVFYNVLREVHLNLAVNRVPLLIPTSQVIHYHRIQSCTRCKYKLA